MRENSHLCGLVRFLRVTILFPTVLLVSCGEQDPAEIAIPPASMAATANFSIVAQRAGATPFISFVTLSGTTTASLSTVSYSISPMPGTVSAPVRVSYTAAALRNRGYVTASDMSLPVFGLYANASNVATIGLTFNDGSTKQMTATIATPPYAVASPLKTPKIDLARSASANLGFDFFATKPARIAGPVTVLDTDGNIRWVSTTPADQAVLTTKDGFVIGETSGKALIYEGWDGKITRVPFADQSYNLLHHDISSGPLGLFVAPTSAAYSEDLLVEIRADGSVAKTFDFREIFGDYMRSQGDDPASFIRAEADWFHLNSQIYDPSDNSIIVSSRENFVAKIDYATLAVKWIFGDTTKYWYTFPSLRAKALSLPSDALVPIGQHALSLLPDGQVLMFNNGQESRNQPVGAPVGLTRSYSAITAFFVDGAAQTATPGILIDENKGLNSPVCSSVYTAADGSMLAGFSATPEGLRVKGYDPQRRVVFDILFEGGCNTSWNTVIVPLQTISITS